jgi:putative protease
MVLSHRIATFHTEHCTYAHLLSEGRDFRTCGRPCESHRISLRDHHKNDHPVTVDAGCRNTVFDAHRQSAALIAPALVARGVKRWRVEFTRESRDHAAHVIRASQALLRGVIPPDVYLRDTDAVARIGVGDGAMSLIV